MDDETHVGGVGAPVFEIDWRNAKSEPHGAERPLTDAGGFTTGEPAGKFGGVPYPGR